MRDEQRRIDRMRDDLDQEIKVFFIFIGVAFPIFILGALLTIFWWTLPVVTR